MRTVTLSFDDGFRASSLATAAIFEKRGLVAEFHVLSDATWQGIGDFDLWRELAARGHSIQPHGTDHTNKSQIPLADAQEKIGQCLDSFAQNLPGFDPARAIFGFPYNASTPELEAWLPTVVRAFRTSGPAINSLPDTSTTKLTTGGWADAEPALEKCLEDLLTRRDGWLIYNAHGLDGEGWGPLGATFLERQLDRLLDMPDVQIVTARDMLAATV